MKIATFLIFATLPGIAFAATPEQFNAKCAYSSHTIEGKNTTGGEISAYTEGQFEYVFDVPKMEYCLTISCPGGTRQILRKDGDKLIMSESPIYEYADDNGDFTSDSNYFDTLKNEIVSETVYYKNAKGKQKGKLTIISSCEILPYNKPTPLQ